MAAAVYRPADADQILEAARQVIEQKMQRGEASLSPAAVKEYLLAKLAGFEHEVFAVLFLDTKQRLIDYVEMFHGTIDAADVHPREVVRRALTLTPPRDHRPQPPVRKPGTLARRPRRHRAAETGAGPDRRQPGDGASRLTETRDLFHGRQAAFRAGRSYGSDLPARAMATSPRY